MKEEKLEKKPHFKIKKKTGYLLCFATFSNIYVCLLDYKRKIIITKTAGNCKVSAKNNKREKIALHNILKIVEKLNDYFEVYKIKYIKIFLRGYVKRPILYLLENFLERYNVRIISIRYILCEPHNGIRKRGKRRV